MTGAWRSPRRWAAWLGGAALVALLSWWHAVAGLIAGLLLLRVAYDQRAEPARPARPRAGRR